MKFSIVIPVVPRHDKYLTEVFSCLSSESDLIGEIIVARSELAPHRFNRYKKFIFRIAKKYRLESKVILSAEPKACLAYSNLNRGWGLAKSDYVTFLGADDLYAPYRLRVIDEALNQNPSSNMVLHGYFFQNENTSNSNEVSPRFIPFDGKDHLSHFVRERIITTNEIFSATFPTGKRDYLSECFGNTNLKIPTNKFGLTEVTMGNATVRTNLRERVAFKPLQYGEDGVLCLDILENFGNVLFVAAELSIYRKYLSANRIPTRISYLKHKILRFTPKFLIKVLYN